MPQNLGEQAISAIYDHWQVDPDRSRRGPKGFDWWPGHFKVSVRTGELSEIDGMQGHRLSVSTQVLRTLPAMEAERAAMLDALAKFAPTYAYRAVPEELLQAHNLDASLRSLHFDSTAFVRAENADWLPSFLAGTALLQPIDAQTRAEMLVEALGGEVDRSTPRDDGALCDLDPMLDALEGAYLPMGEAPSRWSDAAEFKAFEATYARSDRCFGLASDAGLTLETPFAADSALIQLHADRPHPQLGNGLLVTLQLPFAHPEPELCEQAIWLNFNESISENAFPLIGSWFTIEMGARGRVLAFGSFIPNALYRENLATNLALWMLARAAWVRRKLFPDLEDLTMAEILGRRSQS